MKAKEKDVKEVSVQYKILNGCEIDALESMVNEHLKKGWKLQGGAFMIKAPGLSIGGPGYYAQTIIKEESK